MKNFIEVLNRAKQKISVLSPLLHVEAGHTIILLMLLFQWILLDVLEAVSILIHRYFLSKTISVTLS